MRYNKIVLAGGNGYLGRVLAGYYKKRAAEIVILSRKPAAPHDNVQTVVWDGATPGEWMHCLEQADLLVNLCGKNVNCRYTPANRAAIVQSRTVPTQLLGRAITQLQQPPRVWINVTSATIYRHAEDHAQDEATGETGTGFSIEVCRQWEESFFNCHTPRTRKIALRMGIVLGREDGIFPRLLNLVKAGLGGKQGNGLQHVAWVHEHDMARSTEWLLQQEELSGVFNCTAPQSIQNKALMQLIRKTYGVPVGLHTPQWLLELGAVIIGTEPELVLKSRWVYPGRLLQSGFDFSFGNATFAVHDILSRRA